MGRIDIPLGPTPEPEKELPRCAWCGDTAKTVCGRCKARSYCGSECQRLDWKSGHQTACVGTCQVPDKNTEEARFQFYDVPYVAHWAINLERWNVEAESKEFAFLLSRIPDEETRKQIASKTPWSAAKVALAKELAVRRMAEILTQAIWKKVQWQHDDETERDFLVEREEYIWTGNKYQNSNVRFPNFNFCFAETDTYLFLVSHPVAITGLHVAGALSNAMPDPREAFGEELAAASAVDEKQEPQPLAEQQSGSEQEEDARMLGNQELIDVCLPDAVITRRERLRLALVGKFAYFRTLGQTAARQWSQVVLKHEEVAETVQGGSHDVDEPAARPGGPRRHHLVLGGRVQPRWRCDVHKWRGNCIVVCRGPPEEAVDPKGHFQRTQAARYLEIDSYDKALDHMEPGFIEVPIQELLPEKWHSDYVRACGGGERGDQLRMNYSGRYQADIPKV